MGGGTMATAISRSRPETWIQIFEALGCTEIEDAAEAALWRAVTPLAGDSWMIISGKRVWLYGTISQDVAKFGDWHNSEELLVLGALLLGVDITY